MITINTYLKNKLSLDSFYFVDVLANFLKAIAVMIGNITKALGLREVSTSLTGIKKGYQSYYLYTMNDIQWVLKLLCFCITLLLLSNRSALLLPVCLLTPSNSSLNLNSKYTTKKLICKQLSQKIV